MKSDAPGQLFSWMHPALEMRATGRYGQGVFATENIAKGETVVVMGGYAREHPLKSKQCGFGEIEDANDNRPEQIRRA